MSEIAAQVQFLGKVAGNAKMTLAAIGAEWGTRFCGKGLGKGAIQGPFAGPDLQIKTLDRPFRVPAEFPAVGAQSRPSTHPVR